MASCGTFSSIPVGGKVSLSINFAAALAPGDLLAFGATAAVIVSPENSAGADPNAAALANGAAVVNGATVSQFVGGAGVPGVLYALVVTAPTALGESLVRYGNFKFEAVG